MQNTSRPLPVRTPGRAVTRPSPPDHCAADEGVAVIMRKKPSSRVRTGMVCLVMALGLMALLIPASVRAFRQAYPADRRPTLTQWGQAIGPGFCRMLVNAGLPATHSSFGGVWPEDLLLPTDTADTADVWDPAETTEDSTEMSVEMVDGTDGDTLCERLSEPLTEPLTEPFTEPLTEPLTEPFTEPVTERAPEETSPHMDAPEATLSPGIMLRDMSERQRGARHLWNDTAWDPAGVSADWTYHGYGTPRILLVCSHPFAAYADGDSGGTVSDLANQLAEQLRARGISVLMINSAMSGLTFETSLRETYARTQALVRYYCHLYPDICLVLDLRRSAETVAEGLLLATDGQVDGTSCVQLRLIVDALREDASADTADDASTALPGHPEDLSFAITLRQRLWDISPALTRPVWWRAGSGLIPCTLSDDSAPLLLTVEVGAAGDTYERAAATLPYLAAAIADAFHKGC